jgi:VWFA-related protein
VDIHTEEASMVTSFRRIGFFVLVVSILFPALSSHAQNQGSSGTVQITTVVTALGPKYTAPPPISQSDVSVYSGKEKQNVTAWFPAQGDKANLELAIVIDDSDRIDLGSQINDITSFIKAQPKTCGVGVFYASNGTVQAASQFSTDHEAAAKSVRLPFGNVAAYSSIYLSIMDLIKRWPVTGARREMLLIADGIDRFRGDPFSPDVDSAIERAQRAGVMIHTLYASGVGRFSRNSFQVNYGQSNLAKMADATGGEAFFQGLQTPISFAPFLEQLNVVLNNQYWLKFETPRSKKKNGEMRSIRVRTEQRDVDLSATQRVFVPGGASE